LLLAQKDAAELGKMIFKAYQEDRPQDIEALLPSYRFFMNFAAEAGKDTNKMKTSFTDENAFRNSMRATLIGNYEKTRNDAKNYGINWKETELVTVEPHPLSDTLASGKVWSRDGVIINLRYKQENYILVIESTYIENGLLRTSELLLFYKAKKK
jgi:hypothetical protein